jgi:hypothetical protein
MKARVLVLTLVAMILAALGGTLAPAAAAADPIVIDLSFPPDCPDGAATVPAGVPVIVELGSFTTGTYGLTHEFLLKQVTTSGVLRDGVLTLFDETDAWSAPEQIGKQTWHTLLPSIELGTLTSGESVGVGTLTTFTQPIEVVFPPVWLIDFGPFHISADDVFFNECLITAV